MDVGERDAWLQERYARIVDILMRISFALSAAGFLLYLAGVPAPLIPPDDLPQLWGLPLEDFLALSGAPTGWAWLGFLGHADYLCLAALAVFPCVILLCDLAVLAGLVRRGERLMAALVATQVAVLAVAASNLLG